jgi:hypothetical protein
VILRIDKSGREQNRCSEDCEPYKREFQSHIFTVSFGLYSKDEKCTPMHVEFRVRRFPCAAARE